MSSGIGSGQGVRHPIRFDGQTGNDNLSSNGSVPVHAEIRFVNSGGSNVISMSKGLPGIYEHQATASPSTLSSGGGSGHPHRADIIASTGTNNTQMDMSVLGNDFEISRNGNQFLIFPENLGFGLFTVRTANGNDQFTVQGLPEFVRELVMSSSGGSNQCNVFYTPVTNPEAIVRFVGGPQQDVLRFYDNNTASRILTYNDYLVRLSEPPGATVPYKVEFASGADSVEVHSQGGNDRVIAEFSSLVDFRFFGGAGTDTFNVPASQNPFTHTPGAAGAGTLTKAGRHPIEYSEFQIINLGGTIPALAGDADGNGVVNVADVTHIKNFLSGKIVSVGVPANADVDGNGVINQADVDMLVNMITN